ncbi:hypothetical protein SAMN04487820_11040 [Actinopolyspora mzabensis]|uniref:Uncharacterized protein n=1 Tax=Actinopolyspora mzabensis TaxID=995066 RepID=A0A1G9DEF8_ACTMZ|nr:hypothetical protein [Actinopolyspora mzabensis]SDK62253.1 hypothetical protein SAMN04487820_11040 [Actinopolyspora mzabensis]
MAIVLWYPGVMDSFDTALLVIQLLGGLVLVVGGALAWMGRVTAGSWERGTRANRDGGRNVILFGLMIGANAAAVRLSGIGSDLLTVVAFVAIAGFLALSILHRRKYGPRPQPGERYSSKRLAG